jgi:hypothetical protein
MSDNFQSRPVVKTPKAAKTVIVKTKSDATEVVAAATINQEALMFNRQGKKERAKQEQ